ncbi:MAG: hypothetical protein IJT41_07300 [Clostridia bacterium]|nr:hypothetical protein [Clostridia bacterium]
MKKLLPLFLALLFLLTLPVSAAAGKLTAEAETNGKTAVVTVSLKNPGIIATRIFVRYDSKVLRLEKAENGEIFALNKATFGRNTADNPYVLLWDDGMRRDNITTSGTLCTLTFAVTGGTANGKTNVRIALDQASTFDVNLKEVTVEDCSVLVDVPVDSNASTTASTTKAPGTTAGAAQTPGTAAERTTLPTPPATKAGTTPSQPAKTTAPSGKTSVTASAATTAAGTTKAGVPVQTTAAQSGAAQTTGAVQTTAAASTVQEGGAQTSAATVPAASDAAAVNATTPDGQPETVPDLLTAAGETVPQTDASGTQTQPEVPTEAKSSGAKYLWFLLAIPVAAVVIVLLRKKK